MVAAGVALCAETDVPTPPKATIAATTTKRAIAENFCFISLVSPEIWHNLANANAFSLFSLLTVDIK
jgi:hypothetical protein